MAILDLAAGRRRSPRPEVITNALAGQGFEHPPSQQLDTFGKRAEKISWIRLVREKRLRPTKMESPMTLIGQLTGRTTG